MFKKILIATDGSDHAAKALDVGLDLAKQYQATVFLVHAYPDVSDMIGAPTYDDLISHRVVAGNLLLDKAIQPLQDAGVTVIRELIAGSPGGAIVRIAETRQCDLIVMGARGLGDLAGLLLGSVSHQVIQHAHCPVLVAR